jgi:hypothetical protein
MKTGAAVIGFVVAAGVGAAVALAFKSGKDGGMVTVKEGAKPSAAAAGASPSGAPAAAGDVFKVPVGTGAVKGPADALEIGRASCRERVS